MKSRIRTYLAFIALTTCLIQSQENPDSPPNIVFFLVDDLGDVEAINQMLDQLAPAPTGALALASSLAVRGSPARTWRNRRRPSRVTKQG